MNTSIRSNFTSSLERRECIAVLAYFPVHILILPVLLGYAITYEVMSEITANIFVYAFGMAYMLLVGFRFLRRDFDPLCDHPGLVIRTVAGSYLWMLISNYGVNDLILAAQDRMAGEGTITAVQFAAVVLCILPFVQDIFRRTLDHIRETRPTMAAMLSITGIAAIVLLAEYVAADILIRGSATLSNPNNEAVIEIAGLSFGQVTGMTVFMAPIVEEFLFRAGLFGTLARRNRILAYAVSILAFSFYHIYHYVAVDPRNLVYLIQYLPISFLLCRSYEKTNSIWSSIFLHMMINGISMMIIQSLGGLL